MTKCEYCNAKQKTSFMKLDTGRILERYRNSVDGFYVLKVHDTNRYTLLCLDKDGKSVVVCSNDINYCPMCGKKLTEVQE